MIVTLNLPPGVEQAYLVEAASRGLTPDEFVSEVLVAREAWQHLESSTGADSPSAQLHIENGVPVLHTGRPMTLHLIDDTLELVRRERDLSSFGTF